MRLIDKIAFSMNGWHLVALAVAIIGVAVLSLMWNLYLLQLLNRREVEKRKKGKMIRF